MDAEEVQRLAEQENAQWGARPEPDPREVPTPTSAPSPSREEVDTALRSGQGRWVAYNPLGTPPEEATGPADESANIVGFHAVALDTVLVVRFRWLADPQPHDYLLHLNCTNLESGKLIGVSTLLLERLKHLAHRWPERETIPLSEHVSLVKPPH